MKFDKITYFSQNKPGLGKETAVNKAHCKALCHRRDAALRLTLGKQMLWHMYALKAEGLPLMFSLLLTSVFLVKALQIFTQAKDRLAARHR